jgi:hypothetical protein
MSTAQQFTAYRMVCTPVEAEFVMERATLRELDTIAGQTEQSWATAQVTISM